jgi:hypothetical protein
MSRAQFSNRAVGQRNIRVEFRGVSQKPSVIVHFFTPSQIMGKVAQNLAVLVGRIERFIGSRPSCLEALWFDCLTQEIM